MVNKWTYGMNGTDLEKAGALLLASSTGGEEGDTGQKRRATYEFGA